VKLELDILSSTTQYQVCFAFRVVMYLTRIALKAYSTMTTGTTNYAPYFRMLIATPHMQLSSIDNTSTILLTPWSPPTEIEYLYPLSCSHHPVHSGYKLFNLSDKNYYIRQCKTENRGVVCGGYSNPCSSCTSSCSPTVNTNDVLHGRWVQIRDFLAGQ
jgi:hypothetical protein